MMRNQQSITNQASLIHIDPLWRFHFCWQKNWLRRHPQTCNMLIPAFFLPFSMFLHLQRQGSSLSTSKAQRDAHWLTCKNSLVAPGRCWMWFDVFKGWTSYENLVNLMIFSLSIWQLNPWTDFRVHVRNAICQYVLSSIFRRLYRHIESIE